MGRGALSKYNRVVKRAIERVPEFRTPMGSVGFEREHLSDRRIGRGKECITKIIKHEGKSYITFYIQDGDETIKLLNICHAVVNQYFQGIAKLVKNTHLEEWNTIGRKLQITLNVERAMKERK